MKTTPAGEWSDPSWTGSPPWGVFRIQGRSGTVYYRIFACGPIWHNSITEEQLLWWQLVRVDAPFTEAPPERTGQQTLFEAVAS